MLENAEKFQKGKIISIRNGRSEVFKERMRLEIDRWGKIQDEPVIREISFVKVSACQD